jgi:hypothetical protein
MKQLFSLRKSLRQYASHLNREQRRQWILYRLDRRHVLHPANAPQKGRYNEFTGARLA